MPPHIRLGKKKIAVLDRRLREKTSADQQGQDKSEERGPECRTVHHGPFCDTPSPPSFTFHFSLPSTFFSLSSFLSIVLFPLPFFFNLHHTFSRFSSLSSLSLSPPSLLFSLSLQGKTLSASFALGPWTRTRDVNRSKVGMANLRTVTNTIWAHLFFSSTVLSLRPTLASIFRRGRAVSRSRTIYSNRRDSSNFSRSTANGRRERPRGERIRSKGRAEFQAKHDEKIAYSSVRCWKLLYGG